MREKSPFNIISETVKPGLCARCGACVPICPRKIIKLNEQHYPYIENMDRCLSKCNMCINICPGKTVDFNSWDDEIYGKRPHPESITGIVKNSLVGYSVNKTIREIGASGGIVTQLLAYMLEKDKIDGALVLGSEVNEKGYHIKPVIARSVEELKKTTRSKYLISPQLTRIQEIIETDGRYAIVALPCQTHAIRKYLKISRKLRERVKLVIGLHCNTVYEPYLLDEMIAIGGYKREEITNVEFRGGEWPGYIEFTLKDGEVVRPFKFEEVKDAINTLKLFYSPRRCNLCLDFSAEYADLTVADPWLRGKDGSYLYDDTQGWTTILTRTETGDRIIQDAVSDGYIITEDIPLRTYMMSFERNASYKRNYVPKNIKMRQMFRVPIPEYSRPLKNFTFFSYLPVLAKVILLYLSRRSKTLRFIGVKIFNSDPAMKFFAWNRNRKKRGFSSEYEKTEKFVRRIEPKKVEKEEK